MTPLFPVLLAAHLVGDWIVQTDWQATYKGWPWREMVFPPSRSFVSNARRGAWWYSVRANQAHCLTYHLTMAAFVLPFWRSWGVLVALAVSWATHGFIDRRWPVKALLRATGSRSFAEQTWGVLCADQALHVAILAVIAAVAA